MKLSLLVFATVCALLLHAEEIYPKNSHWNIPDKLASDEAVKGGVLKDYLGPTPKSLNYYLDNNTMSATVQSMLYESMIEMGDTLEYDRALAYKWSISDDKKTFVFWIDPEAKWSDGKPLTAEDVKWTYDAIVDPKNMTGVHKLALERFSSVEVTEDGKAIKCVAHEAHWENLGAIGGMNILPKHVFGKMDFNKINFDFPVVSGPYRIRELKEGFFLSLERRKDWWRANWKSNSGKLNFDEIKYIFYEDQNNAFDAFLKGEIDVMQIYTARFWEKLEMRNEKVRKNWIVKQSIHNKAPIGFQGFAMNMRRTPFNDLRVRQAMAHLMDRPTINSTMMFNQYFMHRSFWEDLYDKDHPCSNPVYDFNVAKACALLDEAGWKINLKTGIREKDGKPLAFSFLNRSSGSEKIVTTFKTQLDAVGIRMDIVSKDWSAWAKDMDEFNYDMTWAAWGAGLFKDPEGMWLSTEATRRGGNNITGFADPKVDELIKSQRTIFDVAQRHDICRQIDALICAQCPYVLLWNIDYTRLLYWNKFGTPTNVLGRYGHSDYMTLWWADEDTEALLEDAMGNGESLPAKPARVEVR
ncbi:MAG: ABC transporter substrate-binding protein [Victivallales bacterium]|nr:ABC transporter substrate-binding protein [Victivallales bacterium]